MDKVSWRCGVLAGYWLMWMERNRRVLTLVVEIGWHHWGINKLEGKVFIVLQYVSFVGKLCGWWSEDTLYSVVVLT